MSLARAHFAFCTSGHLHHRAGTKSPSHPFRPVSTARGTAVARRLFHCPSCAHRLRFGAPVCGNCFQPTPIWNRKLPYWLAALVIPLLGLIVVAS
ncbi:hypothetical protein MALG_02160 [Marinovum algicola DG 898]|nr:hypothetical protein MALG_02160 [Marinovum algicola DG 898]